MRNFLLVALLLAACSSSTPNYSKNTSKDPSGETVIRLESVSDMSAASMRSALFTEAAHATIDEGNVYLRVDEISADSSVAMKESATPNADPVTKTKSDTVSLSRHRSGVIRFQASRERPASGQVYSATELLDRIRAGSVP
jgi:hypothetical protein